MGHYRKTFHIGAPVEEVWELMCDPSRLTEWNTAFEGVTDASGRLDEVGVTFTQIMRVGGIQFKGRWEITGVESLRRREFQGTPPGCVSCSGRDTFEPMDGGTDLMVELDYKLRGGVFGRAADRVFARPLMERVLQGNLLNLRRILE